MSILLAALPQRKTIMQGRTDAPAPDVIEALIKGAQQGDAASFAELYQHFYDKIFRYVSFKTGDAFESEDITEDVFLRMLESIHSFKWKGYPFSSWLFRIAHNLVVDHFRKKSRRKSVPLENASQMAGSTSHDMDSDLDLKLSFGQVYDVMAELTKLQREVISLRFAAGLSVRETGHSMGKKENAVKALQHAAIKRLRSLLDSGTGEMSSRAIPE